MSGNSIQSIDDLTTVAELANEYPNLFTQKQLEWLVKSRKTNGLEETGAVLKVGRRLYLKRTIFFVWILSQR